MASFSTEVPLGDQGEEAALPWTLREGRDFDYEKTLIVEESERYIKKRL
jgi:hypothetical protein